MKIVHYKGPFRVSVKEIGKSELQHADNATFTNAICDDFTHVYYYVLLIYALRAICGSDCQVYQSRTVARAASCLVSHLFDVILDSPQRN